MKPSRVEVLLAELCVELGFCLPPKEIARLSANPPGSAEDFTEALFLAEGVDVRHSRRLWKQVRDIVAKHFRRWEDSERQEPDIKQMPR